MTDLLEKAFALARSLPAERQDELARVLLDCVEDDGDLVELTPEEQEDVRLSQAEAARGEFATDEEMQELWAKYAS